MATTTKKKISKRQARRTIDQDGESAAIDTIADGT
jgi:hypothetical protein